MGQAKQRGAFEQRKAEAIEREQKRMEERREELRRIEAAKTPAQRQRERQSRARLTGIMSAAIIGSGAVMFRSPY